MASTYTETPDNYSEIKESVVMMHVRFKGIRT